MLMTERKRSCNCNEQQCCCRDYYSVNNLENIFDQYLPLVGKICNKYFLTLYDTDDLRQEALIVCYQSLKKFDPDLNITFGAFYRLNLERRFCSLLRKQTTKKRASNLLTTSYEFLIENSCERLNEHSECYDIEAICLSKFELENILKNLTCFEKQVLVMQINSHKTPKQIANELNVSINKIYHTLHDIKVRLRHKLY